MKTLFCSQNLIGDTITQTPAIRRYKQMYPDRHVTWMLNGNLDRVFFEAFDATGVCDKVELIPDWERLRTKDHSGYDQVFLMSCNEAFNIGHEKHCHISQAYGHMIDVDVSKEDILPTVPPVFSLISPPSRCMVISPCSASNDRKGPDGFSGNKVAPWQTWHSLVKFFRDAGRIDDAVFLLGPEDPEPTVSIRSLRLPLHDAASYIDTACILGGLYAGVDNGITHIASGLKVPTFVIYCEGISESWVSYSGFPHYRIAKVNPAYCRPVNIWYDWSRRLWN